MSIQRQRYSCSEFGSSACCQGPCCEEWKDSGAADAAPQFVGDVVNLGGNNAITAAKLQVRALTTPPNHPNRAH
jgi:hypothetical protein